MALKVRDIKTREVLFTDGVVNGVGSLLCEKADGTNAGSYPIEELEFYIVPMNIFMEYKAAVKANYIRDKYEKRVITAALPSAKQTAQIIDSLFS